MTARVRWSERWPLRCWIHLRRHQNRVSTLPTFEVVNDIQVLSPVQLMTAKVISAYARQNQPKGFSDLRDLYSLMITFPELTEQVQIDSSNEKLREFWQNIQDRGIETPDSDDDLLY